MGLTLHLVGIQSDDERCRLPAAWVAAQEMRDPAGPFQAAALFRVLWATGAAVVDKPAEAKEHDHHHGHAH
jgi:hypothetical protein